MQFVIVSYRTAVKTAHKNQYTLSTGWNGDSSQAGRKINTLCQQVEAENPVRQAEKSTHFVNRWKRRLQSDRQKDQHTLSTGWSGDSSQASRKINTLCQQVEAETPVRQAERSTHFVKSLQWRLSSLSEHIGLSSTIYSEDTPVWAHIVNSFLEDSPVWTHPVNRLQWGLYSPNTCC